jgi:hypothetical protein
MKTSGLLVLALVLCLLTACEEYVPKSKYDQLAKTNAELSKQLSELQESAKKTPHHHYSLHREGLRTFRFDADTGETCIQLTTPDDWKRKETKQQSCQCSDLYADGANPGPELAKLVCGY